MFQHLVYKCHKCHNTLLVSNKMLHDLRCTEENPATYENILAHQSQRMDSEDSPYQNKSLRFSNGLRKSNADGTSSDIKKSKKYNGDDEFIETKYDAEGNIISRKRAEIMKYNAPQNYQGVSDFYEYDEDEEDDNNINNINNYNAIPNNVYIEPSFDVNNNEQVVYETAAAQEIIYEAPAQYDPNITINKPIQETIINSDGNISDNIINDIIRSTMRRGGNNNMNIQINNGNISSGLNNINTDINTSNYNYNNINIDNNNDIFNLTDNFNNMNINEGNCNFVDSNMSNDDILRKTAGIGSHNYIENNMDYQF